MDDVFMTIYVSASSAIDGVRSDSYWVLAWFQKFFYDPHNETQLVLDSIRDDVFQISVFVLLTCVGLRWLANQWETHTRGVESKLALSITNFFETHGWIDDVTGLPLQSAVEQERGRSMERAEQDQKRKLRSVSAPPARAPTTTTTTTPSFLHFPTPQIQKTHV